MKRITLNSQGILDIQDPRKTYIAKSVNIRDGLITYSTPSPHALGWTFLKIEKILPFALGETYLIVSGAYPYLQYLLDKLLTGPISPDEYRDELYQFGSIEEFQACHAVGAI
jgi:hypothetical protein